MIQAHSPSDPPPPWGKLTVATGETQVVRLGPRRLWATHRDGEIWIGYADDPENEASGHASSTSAEPPADMEWARWATPGDEGELFLRPAFPDRALVLEPELPFRMLPGTEARIFVRVPLWIRLELTLASSEPAFASLEEVPSVVLSDTWWGGVMEGEPAYWLPTTARREMRPELFLPHMAVCPLLLRNGSGGDLRVERLALRVAHLSLFVDGENLWADESLVIYENQPEGSRVEMTGRPPAEAQDASLVALPRNPVQRGFRARTFDALRAIPGVGGVW